jgi:membrane fusion protein (multidrug efflux system)
VTAERPARVTSLAARPGDRITIGDPLVILSDLELEQQLLEVNQQIETLTAELAQAERRATFELALQQSSLDERICALQLQVAEYQQQKFESELRRNLLADVLASHETAAWGGTDAILNSLLLEARWPDASRASTVMQMESMSQQSELIAANVEICEERLGSLRSLRASLSDQVREANGVGVTETRLKQARADAERLTARQAQLTIASHAVGQVGTYRVRPGDQLQPGEPIVELLDDAQRFLVAEVPSRRVPEFAPGTTVLLNFPGDEQRQGRVSRVAPQAQPRDGADDPIVEIEIEAAGRLWPLLPVGTRIDVLPQPAL